MRSALVVFLLAVAACSGTTTGTADNLTVSGTWNANIGAAGTPVIVAITLTQQGTTVTGTGTITDSTDPPPSIMNVTGTLVGSVATLTFQTEPQIYNNQSIDGDKAPLHFVGTATATTINGTVNGDGPPPIVNLVVNFTKQ